MENIEKTFGRFNVLLPENIANGIQSIMCILQMQGYRTNCKISKNLKKATYKGKTIESDTRIKISLYNENKKINFSICKKEENVTGIHISSENGTNYHVIFPDEFDDLINIISSILRKYNII